MRTMRSNLLNGAMLGFFSARRPGDARRSGLRRRCHIQRGRLL